MMDIKEALRKMYEGENLSDDELLVLRSHLEDLMAMLAFHGERTSLIRKALHSELYSLQFFIDARNLS